MSSESNLNQLLKNLKPHLNKGEFVFVTVRDASTVERNDILCEFKEKEGTTLIISKNKADTLRLPYSFVSAWISLQIHSALDAVGLTAAISTELAHHNISCNIVAAYYHDHIFVASKDAIEAIEVLNNLSKKYTNC